MRFLIYFAFLPLIGLAQDVPLTEKKVTTDKIEKRDRVLLEKTPPEIINSVMPDKRLYPMKQIGYISNPLEAPFGLNFFTFKNNFFGFYFDLRTDFNVYAPGEWALRDKDWIIYDMGGIATGELEEGGYNIFNVGIAFCLFRSERNGTSLYAGYGVSSLNYFEKYDQTYSGPYYTKHSSVESGNYNIGLLFQYDALISWQIGYDSAVPGIHFGIGFTFN